MSKPPAQLARRYRIDDPKKFRLKQIDPGDTEKYRSEEDVEGTLEEGTKALCELQETLSAQAQWSLLLVFQAMDGAGKDGTIKHVLSGVNPQGCQVSGFRAPSDKELKHDFLWRASRDLPERGRIGIFNRSYYEEVLVVRVHSDYLGKQGLPPKLVTKKIWAERFQSINDFERHLTRNGTVILKFLLHLSPGEQRRRILERLDDPEKNWKFEPADIEERKLWGHYMHAFEEMVRETSTAVAPWHVIPADHKWYTRLAVSAVIIEKLRALHLHRPAVDAEKKQELKKARAALQREKRK